MPDHEFESVVTGRIVRRRHDEHSSGPVAVVREVGDRRGNLPGVEHLNTGLTGTFHGGFQQFRGAGAEVARNH